MNVRLIAAMVVLVFVGVACTADNPDAAYTAADANQDGVIDETEAQSVSGLSEQWGAIDANSDGQIDKAEFSRFEAKSE